MKTLLTLLFIIFSLFSISQTYQFLDYPLTENNQSKFNGFAGGINVPQFSEVDLNADGLMDLYIFDRDGDVQLTYLQVDDNGTPRYKYAPEFVQNFPTLVNWVALRDFDKDGVMDIFSNSKPDGSQGIRVYKGFIEDGAIKFERFRFFTNFNADVISFPINNGLHTNLYVTNIDYPAFDDVDKDGDMDILTFDSGGSWMYYYRNTSQENGFGNDSLHFVLEDDCWGGFYESGLDSEIFLSDTPGVCASGLAQNPFLEKRHAGSTVLSFDEDGDGLLEMFIGDLLSPRISGLKNKGTINVAWMETMDNTFPFYDTPVEINFPASYYLDLNFDGKKDFVAAPNERNNSPNFRCAWFYENTTNNQNPVFDFQRDDFLVESMMDLGTNAFPAIADVTGDGLLDLVVGNGTYYQVGGDKESYLRLYENTGTQDSPAFTLVDDNWLNFNQYTANNETWRFAPAFGDMDNDGDLDLVVGDRNGNLFYAENTGGSNNPMAFNSIQPLWKGIDVGQNSMPNIADINRDGLPDLVIGQRNKTIRYLQNVGTPDAPDFIADISQAPNNSFFGQIELSIPNFPTGFGAPYIVDVKGEYKLFAGNEDGKILLFDNIDNNLNGAFSLTNAQLGNIDFGREATPALADFNNDGLLEMVVGNARGGLNILQTDIEVEPTNTTQFVEEVIFGIQPNPAKESIWINVENAEKEALLVEVYDAVGRLVLSENWQDTNGALAINNLASGLYYCQIIMGKKKGVARFVKY